MDNVKSEIDKLCLDSLANDWVDNIFFYDFMDFDDLPNDYEALLDSVEIQNVFENLLDFIADTEDSDENTWATLSQVVSYRNLLALFGYYLKQGTKYVTVPDHRDNALLVARVYYRLLQIPGARSYEIYHSQLFAQSISCLGFPKLMCEKSDQYRTNKDLSADVNYVLKGLSLYVVDLREIILQLQLTPSDINFEDILRNLVDVAGGAITQSLNNVDRYLMSNVTSVVYQVINCMICNYGEQPNPEAIELLFKCILPKLTAVCVETRGPISYVRASYVTYTGVILSRYCKAAVNAFTILLEHLCYATDMLEKCEIRSARASLVVGLMSLLPDRRHKKFVKWVLMLSTTSKILHRQIALEILSRLLNNEPEIQEQRQTIQNEIQNMAAANQLPSEAAPETQYDESSQDTVENYEPDDERDNEVAGFLRQQPHLVPLGQILRAVYDCAHDVSSTVRCRALSVLCESVSSEREAMRCAMQELNGDGNVSLLMALGARCVSDERAVVRRVAILLIQRLLSTSYAPTPTTNDLTVLINLCRDAAITVRSAALSAINELLTQRPCEATVDAFLAGPVHQLSDPESKVQDQVKSLIEQILLRRLAKYNASGCADLLPWMVLEGITRHNMRRHLQKACAQLAKSEKCISVRLVDTLSSHLGAKDSRRDLQCLVLLTCVAPFVDYSDIGFALDYYYNLASQYDNESDEAKEARDSRLMILVLELLSAWARFARAPVRASLRDHLVQRLASAKNDGCRIQAAMLAAELDPSNLVWASELLQLSEQRAFDENSLEEALRAADLSLVAPTPPSSALLQLFLTTIKSPPPDWSEVGAGACVAGAGRLCIRSRSAARAAAPVLAEILHSNAPITARVNALLALCDISNRYTNIVEPLMDTICGCLERHAPPQLRRTAARSITKLLLGGFLRLRTPLYYNYCALLADADHDVREPAEYYVTICLTPEVIYHHFVDCVLHYNTVSDKMDFDARQLIYDVMLQRLTLVQKLNTQCRLAREILKHAADIVDDGEELPASLQTALLDTIRVLLGPRMRLPNKPQQGEEVGDVDDLQERVTKNIVSHKMKQTVAEVMIPAVMRLYSRLGAGGGQLAAYLVLISQGLLDDYRLEIEELLLNDEDLVVKMQLFRQNIAAQPSPGNMRNLVTTSGPPEPETPKPHRKRAQRRDPPKKRNLKI